MHEYTNLPFRMLAQAHGAEAAIVPLVSVTALARGAARLERLRTELHADEKFLGVQLIGSKPEEFAISAKIIRENFPWVKWLDVNAGCPSKNAMGTGGGAALLGRPKLISRIIDALSASDFPISVKMRLAPTMEKTLEFAKAAQGADLLIVHGRTARQHYSGSADWGAIRAIREASRIPVCGNGDIRSLEQGKKLARDGYCDSFMVGRAALANPPIFSGKEAKTKEEKKRLFREYLKLAGKYGKAELFDCRLKAFELFKSLPSISQFRGELARVKTLEGLEASVRLL